MRTRDRRIDTTCSRRNGLHENEVNDDDYDSIYDQITSSVTFTHILRPTLTRTEKTTCSFLCVTAYLRFSARSSVKLIEIMTYLKHLHFFTVFRDGWRYHNALWVDTGHLADLRVTKSMT